jgi:hypothetical protein
MKVCVVSRWLCSNKTLFTKVSSGLDFALATENKEHLNLHSHMLNSNTLILTMIIATSFWRPRTMPSALKEFIISFNPQNSYNEAIEVYGLKLCYIYSIME